MLPASAGEERADVLIAAAASARSWQRLSARARGTREYRWTRIPVRVWSWSSRRRRRQHQARLCHY
jgi:hypothetical protein